MHHREPVFLMFHRLYDLSLPLKTCLRPKLRCQHFACVQTGWTQAFLREIRIGGTHGHWNTVKQTSWRQTDRRIANVDTTEMVYLPSQRLCIHLVSAISVYVLLSRKADRHDAPLVFLNNKFQRITVESGSPRWLSKCEGHFCIGAFDLQRCRSRGGCLLRRAIYQILRSRCTSIFWFQMSSNRMSYVESLYTFSDFQVKKVFRIYCCSVLNWGRELYMCTSPLKGFPWNCSHLEKYSF